jgi:branched-chain amino acid transport system substrate-binding protein
LGLMRAVLFFLACCPWLLAADGAGQPRPHSKTRVGISVPLTGAAATYGLDVKNVILFANRHIARQAFEFIIEDDQCSSAAAVRVAHKFAGIDKVKYVLGLPCSHTMLSAAPVYERAGVLVVNSYAAAPAIAHTGDYIFRTRPNSIGAMRLLWEYISTRGSAAALLAEQTDYAQDMKRAFLEANARAPGRVVVAPSEDFMAGEADPRSPILKLMSSGASALVILSQTEESAATVVRRVRELKWNAQLYGAFHPGSPTFLKLAGRDAEGLILATLPALDAIVNSEGAALFREFTEEFGALNGSDYAFFTALESVRALYQAVESGEDPRRYLYRTEFNGIFGRYTFDKNGDIVGISHVLAQVQGGRVVPLAIHNPSK